MTSIDELFATTGPLAQGIPGYAPRRPQQEMARAVETALRTRGRLVVEAGTGIGKTLAYLVPVLTGGLRTIISTGTRTLQDQLFGRDIPAIAGALGRPVRIALLKGRANYLCRHRLNLSLDAPDSADLIAVEAWARVTRTGDIAELDTVREDAAVWRQVTSTAENCLGRRCPCWSECHVVLARREAMQSDIVIVNHHLLMADLALREEGFGELLPGADAVILDEAHHLPEVATQFFGISVSSRQLQGLARDTLAEYVNAGADTEGFRERLDSVDLAVKRLRARLCARPGRFAWTALPAPALEELALCQDALQELEEALATVAERSEGLASCLRRAQGVTGALERITAGDDGTSAEWADVTRQSFALHSTPFDAAENLGSYVAESEAAWVFTSATLSVAGELGPFVARLALESATPRILESPFDYENNALLLMTNEMPDPGSQGYTEAVTDVAETLLEASGGRAFLLFTSHAALQLAAERLSRRVPFELLVQGTAPRAELLERFRACGNAVLLGTSSFWQGVDVRGPALSLVLIDKLPFASPSDPLLSARLAALREAGQDPFYSYQLPQAVIALKQGVGRLIRDFSDRGVAVICDPRLGRRRYGKVFLESLPPMRRTDSVDHACAFLREHVAPVEAGAQ